MVFIKYFSYIIRLMLYPERKFQLMRAALFQKVIAFLLVLCIFSIPGFGCLGDVEQIPFSNAGSLSALLVPDTNLEFYVYAKQDRPTIVPATIINLSHDVKVDSLAIWGMPSDKELAFSAGLTFTTPKDASEIYTSIETEKNSWKLLRDNKIYIVKGVGKASETLKTSITNNNFVRYTNESVLQSVAMLPRGDRTKMIALAVARPSQQVLDFASEYIGIKDFEQVNKILKLLNPEIVMGALYSPHQINVAKAVGVFEKGGNPASLDAGGLFLIKSGFPGFITNTAVSNILCDYGFKESRLADFTVYKGFWTAPGDNAIPVLVRIESNYVFVSISAQEQYAQIMLTSIYK
jgi:hypothetical protein